MFTRPVGLPDATLSQALADGWGFTATTLDYAAVGFGSHHWIATDPNGDRRFVTVDDLRANDFDELRRALTTAQVLLESGLDFVVAPLGPLRRLDERYAMAVYPYLDGESYAWGEYPSAAHRAAVLDLLARLHAATEVAAPHAGREDFALPERDHLERGLRDLDEPWEGGPHSEPARKHLIAHAAEIEPLLVTYDRLADAADRDRMVITHGEPHPANTLGLDGRWVLIDWDTALIAPPERDDWMVGENDGDPDVLELYRLRWRLAEIGIGTALFRAPHTETADVAKSWDGFVHYVTGSS